MSGAGGMDVAAQRRRLGVMLAINLVCVLVGGVAAVGAFVGHVQGLIYLFAAALVIGFAAHVWLMLGFARSAGPKGSV
jgi:hypothetical protein